MSFVQKPLSQCKTTVKGYHIILYPMTPFKNKNIMNLRRKYLKLLLKFYIIYYRHNFNPVTTNSTSVWSIKVMTNIK